MPIAVGASALRPSACRAAEALFSAAGQDFGGDYWTVRSDGSSRRRLTHFGPGHTTASAMWSPDGSMILFADSGLGGNDDLYVMRADGGGVRRLTRTPQWESAAVWLRP